MGIGPRVESTISSLRPHLHRCRIERMKDYEMILGFVKPYSCQLCSRDRREFQTLNSGTFVEHMRTAHGVQINHGDIEVLEHKWAQNAELANA